MATFTNYSTILPDPNNKIGTAGEVNASGEAGPGFASISFSSNTPVMKTRTNSGRMISRAIAGHRWTIDITYNPLTRDEFEPVNSFLMARRGSLVPFFIELPQYRVPQDSNLATRVASVKPATVLTGATLLVGNNYIIDNTSGNTFVDLGASAEDSGTPFVATTRASGTGTVKAAAGSTSLVIDGLNNSNQIINVGDMFTFESDSHKKAYMITRVETSTTYKSDSHFQPNATSQRIIHFTPGLQKAVANDVSLNFHLPKIRVLLASDVQSYSLDVNNLYQFSLKLEEAQI